MGMIVLVDVGTTVNILNYSELAKVAFGRTGEWVVDLSIVVYCFGGLMSYITIVGGTSSELFRSWGCTADFCGVLSTTSFFIFVFDIPLCLVRFFGHYGVISIISMISIFSVLILVIIGGPIVNHSDTPILLVSANGTMSKIGSVVFALGCAPATFHAYVGLKNPSTAKWNNVATYSVLIGTFMCLCMGISGYLVFGDAVQGEIISNFPEKISDPFKLLLIIHLILYIPVT
jgi:sodium-coupled neutral amino acid transporter 7/8